MLIATTKLKFLENLLSQMEKEEEIWFPIREFVGKGGIGKSALIGFAHQLIQKKNIPNAFIDFSKINLENPVYIIWQIGLVDEYLPKSIKTLIYKGYS